MRSCSRTSTPRAKSRSRESRWRCSQTRYAAGAGRPVHVVPSIDEVVPRVLQLARAGDAVMTLGAGSIGSVPRQADGRVDDARRPAADAGCCSCGQALPAFTRPSGARSAAGFRRGGRPRSCSWSSLGRRSTGLSRAAGLALSADALTISTITVKGTSRMAPGEALALLDGLARRQHGDGRSRALAAEAARGAVGGRRGDSARLSGHRRRGRCPSASRSASAASGTPCT